MILLNRQKHDRVLPLSYSRFYFPVIRTTLLSGIIADRLIGPVFLSGTLTGGSYNSFLREYLHELLEDVSLDVVDRMWFMYDGASAHFSRLARQFLNERFPDKWIDRGGHLKSLVHNAPVNDVEELRYRIQECCRRIQTTPDTFERVRRSMTQRLEACIRADTGHFEQFL
uniref:Transposase n=1 Tax=Vespula pensylvanica TaxID=30213 RepID=A0A834P749_VESPE|nr:hypothetical protein H0235_004300 [Vespula pensylvanica]